jgi:hypothetical protein
MLFGHSYSLKTATVAINGNRVAVKIPAGSIVTAISQSAENDRMVEVLWEARTYMMFVVDLQERGEEINAAANSNKFDFNAETERVRQALHQDVRMAHERRESAAARFHEIINQIPSGIPSPDGVDRIRQASHHWSYAQREVVDAQKRLENFLMYGTIPTELERKPTASERLEAREKKAGAD